MIRADSVPFYLQRVTAIMSSYRHYLHCVLLDLVRIARLVKLTQLLKSLFHTSPGQEC